MVPHDRREFLRVSARLATAIGIVPFCMRCGDADGPTGPVTSRSTVSIIRGRELRTMTREALTAIGGMGTIVHPGETVFIKPNFVTFPWADSNDCFAAGECTKPEIIIAVAEMCLEAGASYVVIGEGSHLPSFSWSYAVTFDGTTDLAREAARLSSKYGGTVELACLEVDSPGWVDVPSQTSLGKIAVSSLVTSADRVISVPVAKTHSWAQLTLGMKNFIGVTPLDRYAAWVNNSHWDRGKEFDHSSPEAIGQIYLDIVKAVQPDLTVVDLSIGMESDGPTRGSGGRRVDVADRLGTWLVLASKDIVSADTIAAKIMSHDTRSIAQLRMGYHMGLGQMQESHIDLVGERLDDVRMDWAPATLKN